MHQDNPITERLNQTEGFSFYLKVATLAEKLGYNSFWLPDHWTLTRNKGPVECWTTLAAVAAVTDSMKLGSLVTPIIAYPPLVLAKRVLIVQMISKSRVIFGVGAGWHKDEFRAYGVRFPHHRERIDMLEESVRLIKLVWNSESPVNYEGEHYTVSGALLRPRTNPPPLWFGGTSEKLVTLVGKYGDGWVPFEMTPEDVKTMRSRLIDVLDQIGRNAGDIRVAHVSRVVIGKTEKEALDVLRRLGIQKDYEAPDLPKQFKGHLIAGSYEQCAEELAEYVDVGVSHLIVSPQPADKTPELLAVLKDRLISQIK